MNPAWEPEKADMATLYERIMKTANESQYDHRPNMRPEIQQAFPHMMHDYQMQYSRFKLAVAEVLQPKTILELGVGWGVSAQAFFEGCPNASFLGLDNGQMMKEYGLPEDPNWAVNYRSSLPCVLRNTESTLVFTHPSGPIDLLHIDGGHGLENKARDLVKAFEARPEWILVDDFHDVMVAAGTMAGVYMAAANSLHMLYFPNSHTGNLLIHSARKPVTRRGLEIRRVEPFT